MTLHDDDMSKKQSFKISEQKSLDAYNPSYAMTYRSLDEENYTSPIEQRMCGILGEISSGFETPIDVLDLACGTGRYFHCLKNVRKLVGIDLSPAMIEQARTVNVN